MSIERIHQLSGIPDLQDEGAKSIDYAGVSLDAESKLVSLMEAIECIGIQLMNQSDKKDVNADEVNRLAGVICSLSEVSIFYNKISCAAHYNCGIKDGSGVDANQ